MLSGNRQSSVHFHFPLKNILRGLGRTLELLKFFALSLSLVLAISRETHLNVGSVIAKFYSTGL